MKLTDPQRVVLMVLCVKAAWIRCDSDLGHPNIVAPLTIIDRNEWLRLTTLLKCFKIRCGTLKALKDRKLIAHQRLNSSEPGSLVRRYKVTITEEGKQNIWPFVNTFLKLHPEFRDYFDHMPTEA